MNGSQIASVARSVLSDLFKTGAMRATKYLSAKQTVKATMRHGRFAYRIVDGARVLVRAEVLVTIGKPNFAERRFIKLCEKAGEPFPVKKIQLRFPAKPKGKK